MAKRAPNKRPAHSQTGSVTGKIKYEDIALFDPLPWQIRPFRDRSSKVLLSGASGGGKTACAANKVHAYCLHYPGTTALVIRKARADMTNSTLLYLKRKVMGDDPRVTHRKADYRFEYWNGSILAYGGMKDDEQRERIRGVGQDGGVDIVWMEEATHFEEDDFNEVLPRMRGKASNLAVEAKYNDLGDPAKLEEGTYRKYFDEDGTPRLAGWQQVILSTNPDGPSHWINTRLIKGGEATVYLSSYKDNPHNPPDYYEKNLKHLTGVKKLRLVDGLWVEASGIVYDTWSDAIDEVGDHGGNVTYDAEYVPDGGPVQWWVDDGYAGEIDKNSKTFTKKSSPRVILFVQKQADGRYCIFDELYMVKTRDIEQINKAIEMSKESDWPLPSLVVTDRAAASLRGTFKAAGFRVAYNTLTIEEGINETRKWVSADENGWRGLLVHPRCFHLRSEFTSYARDDRTKKPIDAHNHGTDSTTYGLWHAAHGRAGEVDVAGYDPNILAGAVILEPDLVELESGLVTIAGYQAFAV